MKPEHVLKNEFLTNLGTDHIAVDERGVPIARASDRAALTRAAPGAAAYFSSEDFDPVSVFIPTPPVVPMLVPSAPAAPPVTPTEEPVFVMPLGDLPDTPKPDWSKELPNNWQPASIQAEWPAQGGQADSASNLPDGAPPNGAPFGQAPIKSTTTEDPRIVDPMQVTAPKASIN